MANTIKLSQVVARIAEQEEDFRPFELAKTSRTRGGEPTWPLSTLKRLLGYQKGESIERALNNAKISAGKVGLSIKENFVDGSLFDEPGELFLTKYAAMLVVMNADPNKDRVALAQYYFALLVDKQHLENVKRLKSRLDVANENKKLTGVAQDRGVRDFQRFNGIGVSALYGGLNVVQINQKKQLPPNSSYLDYAGSEELAANLFRITQTAAALRRQQVECEATACNTHRQVAKGVRRAIQNAGNLPPEELPAAKVSIDRLATVTRRELTARKP